MLDALATATEDEPLEGLSELDADCELDADEYFFVTDNVNYAVLRPVDIVVVEAQGNYTRITDRHGKCHVIRTRFRHAAERLPRYHFFQASRDTIVNLAHVTVMEPADAKRFRFKLDNGEEVIASRKQSLKFRRTRQF